MATTTATSTSTRTLDAKRPSSSRQKKDQPRTDIWSSLLRQTREAQARSRTHAVQSRQLILCGDSPGDQRTFLDRYLARPPPIQPSARNPRDQRSQKRQGDVRLSNRFGYGYGHVTLYSPPQPSSSALGLFNGEAEEVAKIDVHTLCGAEPGYVDTLRRLLQPVERGRPTGGTESDDQEESQSDDQRAAICILLSWEHPWNFLERLRRWFAIIARALLPATVLNNESPLELLREHQIRLSVVLQHTERQELLLREMYTEEMFDYISQCLRTCLLPVSAALLYVPTNLPPQQPGAPLSEVQKVLYNSLDLDITALQAKGGKPELTAKHNVVDRMAIVVPSGWDSLGKIRLLSETFSPEAVLEGWTNDLAIPFFSTALQTEASVEGASNGVQQNANDLGETAGGAEVFESSHQPSPLATSPQLSPPMSPSKMPRSALKDYENQIQDPNAHRAPKPPEIEVTTQPEQEFLAEMRAQIQNYEAQDAARGNNAQGSIGMMHTGKFNINAGGVTATGEALSELGDVSFNVGGVSYDTRSAEQAIERMKRPQGGASSDSRSGTPRPSRRDQKTGSDSTPGSKGGDIPTEKLEEYFASLMKKGGGGSQSGTPSK